MGTANQQREARREQLKAAANGYFDALAQKSFDQIPYAENVTLRAPLAPGGVESPLIGRETLRTTWWPPLELALSSVQVIEHYINETETAICTEALVGVVGLTSPLRVCDRFTVDAAGKIVEQVNYFDPRDVTNPGWR